MPTARGWAALGAAAALVLLWIGFGERELFAAGAFVAAGTGAGVLFVRAVSPRIKVSRRVTPEQVHEGDRAIVEIMVETRRTVRNLAIKDEVVGLGSARFAASDVDASSPSSAKYEVLCRPRGIYQVGPAEAFVNDPLGLAEAGATVGMPDRLVVYPAVEDLEGFPLVRGQDPSVQTARPSFTHHGGEDFFTLREYQLGDDLRKVHWRSSAKRDDLMIRQLELPWQSRALVLFDHRARTYHAADEFEHAVRGTASVIRHLYFGGFRPELWTLDGPRPRIRNQYRNAMERLAAIDRVTGIDLRQAVARLRRQGMGGGALVMVAGTPDRQNLAAFRLLTRDFSRAVVLSVGRAEASVLVQFRRAGAATIVVDPEAPWAPAWAEAMETQWSTVSAG